jgi:ribosomal protein S27AE
MDNKDLIIIGLVIGLVAVLSFSAGYLFLGDSSDDKNAQNNTNNSSLNNSNVNNSSNQTVKVNKTTTNKKSKNKGLDLTGYTLIDVRYGNSGIYCDVCDGNIERTVYEYVNDEGDRIMIGKNSCPNCGKTSKDYWKDGKWHDY